MAKKYICENEWRKIKRDIAGGTPKLKVMAKHDIADRRYSRVRQSVSYAHYCQLTKKETERRDAYRKIERICGKVTYDRLPHTKVRTYSNLKANIIFWFVVLAIIVGAVCAVCKLLSLGN